MNVSIGLVHHRLAAARTRLAAQLDAIEKQKAALFQKGVAEPSPRLQKIIARQIRDLDAKSQALARSLGLIRKQSMILAHLIYARENADPLKDGLLATVDWNSLLAEVSNVSRNQAAWAQKLDAILAVLNQPAPFNTQLPARALTLPSRPHDLALVAHVPDGDGCELADGRRVRYIGIDAPEISGRDGKPEPFAQKARALNERLVLGKRVRLERDVMDTDRYGRLLRYVFVSNVLVNAELLRAGLAATLILTPNEKYADEFVRLEQEARREKKGMWKQT